MANGFTVGECVGKPAEYTLFEFGTSVAVLSEQEFADWLAATYCRSNDAICANEKADAASFTTELKTAEQKSQQSVTNAPIVRTLSSIVKDVYLVTPVPELQVVQTTPLPTNGSLLNQSCEFIGETRTQSSVKSCHFSCIANGVLTKNIKIYADCRSDGSF